MLLYCALEVLFLLMTSWWIFPLIEKEQQSFSHHHPATHACWFLIKVTHNAQTAVFKELFNFQLLKLRKNNDKSL